MAIVEGELLNPEKYKAYLEEIICDLPHCPKLLNAHMEVFKFILSGKSIPEEVLNIIQNNNADLHYYLDSITNWNQETDERKQSKRSQNETYITMLDQLAYMPERDRSVNTGTAETHRRMNIETVFNCWRNGQIEGRFKFE